VNYTIGGDYSPQYYSKEGAFNGSGVAIASQSFVAGSGIFLYYQTFDGAIKASILDNTGSWQSTGDSAFTVATNARNSTPLSAVAFISADDPPVATWNLFYVGDDMKVKQRISSNKTLGAENSWFDGPLNAHNLVPHDADTIGMQACYWGNFYGDSDYTYTDGFNQTKVQSETGMHL